MIGYKNQWRSRCISSVACNCISSIPKEWHIIKPTETYTHPLGVMRYKRLCRLMMCTLSRDDIPSLSAWINKEHTFGRQKCVLCWRSVRDKATSCLCCSDYKSSHNFLKTIHRIVFLTEISPRCSNPFFFLQTKTPPFWVVFLFGAA